MTIFVQMPPWTVLDVPDKHTGYTDITVLKAAVIQAFSPKMGCASIPKTILDAQRCMN